MTKKWETTTTTKKVHTPTNRPPLPLTPRQPPPLQPYLNKAYTKTPSPIQIDTAPPPPPHTPTPQHLQAQRRLAAQVWKSTVPSLTPHLVASVLLPQAASHLPPPPAPLLVALLHLAAHSRRPRGRQAAMYQYSQKWTWGRVSAALCNMQTRMRL
jgi:hypothetical protein